MTLTKPDLPVAADNYLIFCFSPEKKSWVEDIPDVFYLDNTTPVIFRVHEDIEARALVHYEGKDTKFLHIIDSDDASYLWTIIKDFSEVIDINLLDKLFQKIKKCEGCRYPNTSEVIKKFKSYVYDKKYPETDATLRFLRCCDSRFPRCPDCEHE